MIPCSEYAATNQDSIKRMFKEQSQFLKQAFNAAKARSQNSYLCPSKPLPPIQGRYEEEVFRYIEIVIMGCNSTEVAKHGKECQKDEEIAGRPINFVYQNTDVDLRPETAEEEKIYKFADFSYYMNINPKMRQDMNVFLVPSEIKKETPTDALMIFPDIET